MVPGTHSRSIVYIYFSSLYRRSPSVGSPNKRLVHEGRLSVKLQVIRVS